MEWKIKPLGELCDAGEGIIKTGPFGSQLHQSDYSDNGTPVVMPKDIIGGRVSPATIARVGNSHVERLSQHKLEVGNIVYGRRGDIGRCALVTEQEQGWLCGTGCLRIHLGLADVEPNYLFYFLNNPHTITWIKNQAVGATMPNLNTGILRSIPIQYPTKPTQRSIASILSTYDELVENNTRRIAILEEMARRLYEEWFVHFRFPGHETTTTKETELGSIPDGWNVSAFTTIAKVMSGGTPKKSEDSYWNGAIPFFTPKDAPASTYALDTLAYITGTGLEHCSSKLYPRDTVFITARGTVGKTALASTDMSMNQSCYALRPCEGYGPLYLYLATGEAVRELRTRSHGAVFDTIILDTFRQLNVVVPQKETVLDFESKVRPLFDMILNLQHKNSNLHTQRDLLLPKLISGEIDVSEASEIAQDAAE